MKLDKLKPSHAYLAFAALALLSLPCEGRADLIKQSTTYTRTVLMTASSDHISPYTGAASTLSVQYAQAGGAMTTPTAPPTITAQGNGRFAITLTSAYTGALGALDLTITASGADPSDTHDQVVVDIPGGSVASVTAPVVASSVTGAVTVGTNSDKTGYTVSTVQDKTGYSGTATNFVAAPTVPQIAAGLPTDTTIQADAQAGSYAALNLAGPTTPTAGSLFGVEAADQASSAAAANTLAGLVSGGKFTAAALSLAPTSSGGVGGGAASLSVSDEAKLTLASTAQQAGSPVTLPSTVLSAADIAAVQQAIMTYALHAGVSYQKAVASIYLNTVGAATPTKSGTVQTNPFVWPDGTVGLTSALNSSTGQRTETPGTLPN